MIVWDANGGVHHHFRQPAQKTTLICAMHTLQTDESTQRKEMNSHDDIGQTIYITCSGYKGRPRKPILVCYQCRLGRKCKAFQSYLQPELPFKFINK
jgi:hypothetical protein